MKIGSIRPQDEFLADTWQRVYSNTLAAAATSVTISGLDGNTAEEYILRARIINGYNGGAEYDVRLNNDSGNNYGHQYLGGINTTVATSRNTATTKFYSGYADALNQISMFEQNIYAKSGYIRTAITKQMPRSVSGTTCASLYMFGHSWNNTADNITSIVVIADKANGIGIGSVIELYAKRSKI